MIDCQIADTNYLLEKETKRYDNLIDICSLFIYVYMLLGCIYQCFEILQHNKRCLSFHLTKLSPTQTQGLTP